jgi:thiamine biosynthesis lipoprotein
MSTPTLLERSTLLASSTSHDVTFRAMGSDCQIRVWGDRAAELASLAVRRVQLLEQCWTRFSSASELSRLNARSGQGPQVVSADLLALVSAMQAAHTITDGRFDPTVHSAMVQHGYDVDFESLRISTIHMDLPTPQPTKGMCDVLVDLAASTVALPTGVTLDAGAIGKGLAGDVIVDELIEAGAQGVLVNLGGDIVFAGSPCDIEGMPEAWVIAVGDAASERDVFNFPMDTYRGAVTTSSTLRRRWADGRHHVIDPRSGTMSDSDTAQATVVSSHGWLAEAHATALLLLNMDQHDDYKLRHQLTARTWRNSGV